jgi:hypothetical protein
MSLLLAPILSRGLRATIKTGDWVEIDAPKVGAPALEYRARAEFIPTCDDLAARYSAAFGGR